MTETYETSSEPPMRLYNTFMCTIMLFFTIFSIHFQGVPEFFTPRIVVLAILLVLFAVNIIRKPIENKVFTYDILWIYFIVFQLIYTFIIILANDVQAGASTDLSSTFNFLILAGIMPLIISRFFKNSIDFCKCLVYATLIQSVIVIASFSIPSIRMILETVQAFSMERYTYRVIGLGIAGAGGSVYLACGFIANTYLLTFCRRKDIFLITYFINLFAIALVGRTGFYVACVLMLYYIFFNSISTAKMVNIIKLIAILSIIVGVTYGIFNGIDSFNWDLFGYTIGRLLEIFDEDNTVKTLIDVTSSVPPLSLETLFGTGIIRGETKTGLFFWHDGGYIKRYASIGLLFAVISYAAFVLYIWSLIRNIEKKKKTFILLCLALLYMIEFKEPFIFMLAYPFTLVMLAKLEQKLKLKSSL